MAKYRRPPPSLPAGQFETASTVPAGSSIQEVPAPDSRPDNEGVRRAVALPAMQPVGGDGDGDGESAIKGKEPKGEVEMIVEGVVVPPKPRPPNDEGRSLYLVDPGAGC